MSPAFIGARPLVSRFIQVRGNCKKSGNLSGQGGQWKIFFGKVRESEKLVPPDARFSGKNASNLISIGSLPQTPPGELTVLPSPSRCS